MNRAEFQGPTPERLIKSDGYVAIGDDQQGKRVYHMLDSVLDRTYAALRKGAGKYDEEDLAREYAALRRLQSEFDCGGLMGSCGGVDLNGTTGDASRSFLAKNERQLSARDEVYRAKQMLSHWQWIVVSNVVFSDHPLQIAGFAIGCKSRRRAEDKARIILRGSGESLSQMWSRK